MLAAGGVANGRTLAGVLAMGADGAWIGSAFIATTEATPPVDGTKDLIVASDGADTVWTRAYDILDGRPWPEGIGERVRTNRFTERWDGRKTLTGTKMVERPRHRSRRTRRPLRPVGRIRASSQARRELTSRSLPTERFLARLP